MVNMKDLCLKVYIDESYFSLYLFGVTSNRLL